MFGWIKKLLTKQEMVTVHKNGRVYRFKSFEKATEFMIKG